MEDKKIIKVYSNNSKKSRLKRNKNKFQRVWDAEKQTYIKVRKNKYPVRPTKVRTDWRIVDNMSALKRRQTKKAKSVPVNTQQVEKKVVAVNKPEIKQTVRKEPARIKKAVEVRLHGIRHTWDSKTLSYKRAA